MTLIHSLYRNSFLLSFFGSLFRSFTLSFIHMFILPFFHYKTACKQTQHCWPTTPNIVGCYMHAASVCTPCCMLLDVSKVWNRPNFSANNSKHFFCSVIAEAQRNNVGSVCTALPTLLGPRTLITHGLQRLMGCILPTMHCRSQHCWELLRPFARSLRAVSRTAVLLVHVVYNASYGSFFAMELEKLLVNDDIRATCKTNLSPKHYIKR